tara:strand:+ start:3587 stop:4504 length:918 start_codon:yes stop_codon:yes gene_type:complete
MAVTFKIKRRASSGAAGSPTSLKSGELAYNEVSSDNTLYYGYGDDGSGTATSVVAIAGAGAYATLGGSQTIAGDKTFTGTLTFSAATIVGLDTDDVGEGANNLYYTDTRSRAAISATTGSGVTYNTTTGVIALSGIPNSSLTNSDITVNGATLSLGGSMTVQGTANEVEVSNTGTTITVGLPNDVTIGNDLVVTGDLTVNGTLTTLSSTEVRVEDKNLLLGDTATPTDVTANGGGLTLAGATSKEITWYSATNAWTFNQAINITNSGTFMIANTQVLNASRVMSNVAITGANNTIDNVTLDGGTF